MIKVILDTNAICADYWMQGSSFRILFQGKHLLPIELMIPEVALDEVLNRYKEDLFEKKNAVTKALAQFDKITKNDRLNEMDPSIEELVSKYRIFLMAEIKNRKIKTIPYPKVDHKKIVEHDLKRLKPFKKDGSGYRDYLIWDCVEKQSGSEHEVVFITANAADFGAGPEPHSDLPRREVWGGEVKILMSINEFNENSITQHLKTNEKLKEGLKSANADFFEIYAWVNENLVKTIQREDWLGPIVFSLPEGVCSVSISRLEEIQDISILEVFEIGDGQVLVHCKVKVDLRFHLSASRFDFDHVEVQVLFDEPKGFSGSITMWPSEVLLLGFNFLLDRNTSKLIEPELSFVESSVDRIEFESSYSHS